MTLHLDSMLKQLGFRSGKFRKNEKSDENDARKPPKDCRKL
jgi:hypothetical protein